MLGEGLHWDLAIDTCCYDPAQAASLSTALLGRCERLIFISTISVYRDFARPEMDESAPLHEVAPGESASGYGPLKVLCEAEYRTRWGERLCILRPGVLCGPFDPTGRLAWWVRRVQQGGPWLLPGEGQDRLQYLDVRDCAEFVLRAAEQRLEGCFNLVKPGIALVDWVERLAARLVPATPTATGVDALARPDRCRGRALAELSTLLPNAQAEYAGYGRISAEAAIVHGLNFRPLEETVADLVAWLASNEQVTTTGMTLAEEAALRRRVREHSPS